MRALRLTLTILCLAAGLAQAQYLETVIPVGDSPLDVLWNPASNKVYTADNQGQSVTIIDGATNQVLTTLDVPDYPIFLEWNSRYNKVYCTAGESNRLIVIDGSGDSLTRKVPVRGWPSVMAYNALMDKLYVICYDDRAVRVYDGSADTLVAEVGFGYNTLSALLWHPASNRLFCTTWGDSGFVFVIDCVTDQVVNQLQVGQQPYAMCRNVSDDLVYVGARRAVSILTADGDSVVATIPGCGYAPQSACYVPYPNKLYVGDFNHGGVALVDCSSQSVYDTLLDEQQINDILCDTLHGKVYVVGSWDVFIFDAWTDTLIKSIHLANGYERLAWNSASSRVYVVDDAANAVYVIRDTTTGIAEEAAGQEMGQRQTATVVRGMLRVAEAPSHKPQAASSLLDIGGRKVMELHPGPNDLSRIPPGVYFVVSPHPNPQELLAQHPIGERMKERGEPAAVSRQPRAVTKVIVQR